MRQRARVRRFYPEATLVMRLGLLGCEFAIYSRRQRGQRLSIWAESENDAWLSAWQRLQQQRRDQSKTAA